VVIGGCLLVIAPGLHGQPVPAGPGDTRYSLPKDTEPRQMAFSTATNCSMTIAAGPNGTVWVPTGRGIVRLDPAGRVTRPSANGAPTSDAGAWFADSGTLVRLNADGTIREINYCARIWSYRDGTLRDVTRHYPRLVRQDAAKLWGPYLKYRDGRGVLRAWMADPYRLSRQAFADRVLDQAAARGELKRSDGYKPRSVRDFVAAVKGFLRTRGFRQR
jgi:hypothetical protein